MASHLLGVLKPSVVLQVNRNAGCPPGVTSDRGEKTRRLGPEVMFYTSEEKKESHFA